MPLVLWSEKQMCSQKNNEINDSLVPPTEIRNAMSEDISYTKSKHRQGVRDLRYTKNNSLLNLRFSRHKRSTRSWRPWPQERPLLNTGKNNRFPVLDILGYLKNTHKNPKFGRVRHVPTRELGWEFPGWDLSHFAKFGIFGGILLIT